METIPEVEENGTRLKRLHVEAQKRYRVVHKDSIKESDNRYYMKNRKSILKKYHDKKQSPEII